MRISSAEYIELNEEPPVLEQNFKRFQPIQLIQRIREITEA